MLNELSSRAARERATACSEDLEDLFAEGEASSLVVTMLRRQVLHYHIVDKCLGPRWQCFEIWMHASPFGPLKNLFDGFFMFFIGFFRELIVR